MVAVITCVLLVLVALVAGAPPPISVVGSEFRVNGQTFVPVGFTMVGALTPAWCNGGNNAAQNVHYTQAEMDAAKTWKATTIRLQVSYTGLSERSAAEIDTYKQTVFNKVMLATNNGFYVIISLQDQSIGCGPARPLPPVAAINVWTALANQYKAYPNVMFELWNEPNNEAQANLKATTDPSYTSYWAWPDWLNGRTTAITASGVSWSSYVPTGHQQMANAIRATGATNIIIADGAQMAEVLTGIPFLVDTLNPPQLAYAVHNYYFTMSNPQSQWVSRWGFVKGTGRPLIATEWNMHCLRTAAPGSETTTAQAQQDLAPQLFSYMRSQGIGMTAWGFDLVNTLIADWSYNPTQPSTCAGDWSGGLIFKTQMSDWPNAVIPPTTVTPKPTPVPTTKPTSKPSTCVTVSPANSNFQTVALRTTQSGTFTFSFKITLGLNPDTAYFGLANGAQTAGANYAVLGRFVDSVHAYQGKSGKGYTSDSTFFPAKGQQYSVTFTVNVATDTYDMSAGPVGGTQVQIATGYQFRNAATQITHFGIVDFTDNSGTQFCDYMLNGAIN